MMSLFNFKHILTLSIIALFAFSNNAFANNPPPYATHYNTPSGVVPVASKQKASTIISDALKKGLRPDPLALAGGAGILAAAMLDPLFDGTATNTGGEQPPTGGRWITNDVKSTIANSVKGSCHLARKEYGSHSEPKIYKENGNWICEMDWQLTRNPQFHVTQINDSIDKNPHFDDVVNNLVNNASNGNKQAQDFLRQAYALQYANEPPPPTDINDKEINDLIKDLTESNNRNNDPNTSGGGTGENNNGTGNQDQDQDPNTSGGGTADNLPKFCDWALIVCNFLDWADNEYKPQLQDSKLDVQELELDEQKTKKKIDFNSYCPSPDNFTVSYNKISKNLKISYENHCKFFIELKPFLIGIAGLISLMIISGRVI